MKQTIRNIVCLFICGVLLCGLMPALAQSVVEETMILYNAAGERKTAIAAQPNDLAMTIGWYYNGAVATVLQYEGEWALVRFGDGAGEARGYVRSMHLQNMMNIPSLPTYTLNDASLFAVAQPSNGAAVVCSATRGERISLMGYQGAWWHVIVDDVSGFIPVDGANLTQISGDPTDGYSAALVNNPDPNERLNLRTTASATAASKGKYYNGVSAIVLGSANNGFVKVRIGSLEGFMQAQYLLQNAQPGSVISAMPMCTVSNVNGTGLNLRKGQGTTYEIIRLLPNGTSVWVMGIGETWAHVLVDNQMGFVMASGLNPRPVFSGEASDTSSSSDPQNGYFDPGYTHTFVQYPFAYGSDTAMVYNAEKGRSRLNLRTAPTQTAKSLALYYTGMVVTVLEVTTDGWAKVRVGSMEGYMMTQYLLMFDQQPTSMALVKSGLQKMHVNAPGAAGRLLLRSGPSSKYDDIGSYTNGTSVILLGFTHDGWAHVIVDNKMGFMWGNYLE